MGNEESTVRVLIEAGANVHAKSNVRGRTPLHFSKSKAVVEVLVGAGASVTATDKVGYAIAFLSRTTLRGVTPWLGADTHLLQDGWTPHHRVCWNGGVEEGTVKALVAAGADMHARDKVRTPSLKPFSSVHL